MFKDCKCVEDLRNQSVFHILVCLRVFGIIDSKFDRVDLIGKDKKNRNDDMWILEFDLTS